MRALSALEVSKMRATQSSAMNDLCNIVNYATSMDAYGDPVLSPVVISGVACGVSFVGPFEGRSTSEGHTQVDYDAIIRLPVTVALVIDSQITVVDKADKTINQTFKLTRLPEIGPSAQNVMVKKISN